MNAVNKPLHKDLSFWIVAVVLVSAASATQLYYGIPWFNQRLAQARPAPRSVQAMTVTGVAKGQAHPNLNLVATNAAVDLLGVKQASQTP